MREGRQQMLDVVRGIAILAVLAFHLRIVTGMAGLDAAIQPVVDLGWVGVDLFFVLSGFLVGRLILTAASGPGGLDRADFFSRRILRLWPVLYLYLAMIVAAGVGTGSGAAWSLVWPVMLHTQNYATHIPSHLWSLAVEEHFYLVAALALPELLRRTGARGVAVALLAILIGSLALRLIALEFGEPTVHLQWQTHYRADSIAAGVLLAWLDRYRPDLLAEAQRHRAALLIAAGVGFGLLAAIPDDRFRYTIGLTIAYCASAAFILGVHGTTVTPAFVVPARMLAALGTIAYPLYIFHVSFGRIADAVAISIGIDQALVLLIWRFALVTAGAAMISRLVERPIMRLRDRSTNRSSSDRTAAAI